MAIRIRRGKEEDLDFSKLKEAEMALTTDTKKLFFCYSPGNVKKLQTAEELQNLLDASPEAYQALQQLIADLSASPNELANILSSISALESGKVSKTDLVQTDQVNNPEKVPSSAVTHALGQEIDTLNNNLAQFVTTFDVPTGSPYTLTLKESHTYLLTTWNQTAQSQSAYMLVAVATQAYIIPLKEAQNISVSVSGLDILLTVQAEMRFKLIDFMSFDT